MWATVVFAVSVLDPSVKECIRCFLGELCDKTFLATLVLTAWCPLYGARSGRGFSKQAVAVFLGSASALCLWVFVSHRNLQPDKGDRVAIHWFAVLMTFVLAARAWWDLSIVDRDGERDFIAEQLERYIPLPARWNPMSNISLPWRRAAPVKQSEEVSGEPEITWNSIPFLRLPTRIRTTDVESVTSYGGPSGEGLEERMREVRILLDGGSSSLYGLLPDFLVPFFVVSVLEVEDKSQLIIGSVVTWYPCIAACLGVVIAAFVASLTGFVLTSTMSDSKVLFGSFLTCCLVFVMSLSQATLQLGALQPSAEISLLSFSNTTDRVTILKTWSLLSM